METSSPERCISCVMPRTAHSVRFDGDTCSLCSANKGKVAAPGDSASLNRHIEHIREAGRGREFDCLVGVSGGRDSSYLLHQLVRRHGLRCLAAYHRTPFTPDVIDANVRRMTQVLNVPLVEMDISKERHRKIAREAVLLWTRKPLPVIANFACASCKQHNREILRIAREHNVRYLVMGSNRYEAFQLTSGYQDAFATSRISSRTKVRQLVSLFRKGALALTRSRSLWRHLSTGIRAVLYISPDSPYLSRRYPGTVTFNYFYDAEWNEMECEQALSELGWQVPPNCNTSWRADCAFAEVKNHMFQKMSGVTYSDAFFSALVRGGVLSRAEALRRLESEGRPSPERLAEAFGIMDLPTSLFS